jgi:hypothetical protein
MVELRVAKGCLTLTANKLTGDISYMVVVGACVFYHVVKATSSPGGRTVEQSNIQYIYPVCPPLFSTPHLV